MGSSRLFQEAFLIFLCYLVFASTYARSAERDSSSNMRHLLAQMASQLAIHDPTRPVGYAAIEPPMVSPNPVPCHPGSDSKRKIATLEAQNGVVALKDGQIVAFFVHRCPDSDHACLSFTSSERVTDVTPWFSKALQDGRLERREIAIDYKGKTLILHNALPADLRIDSSGKEPIFIYEIKSKDIE